MVLFLNKDNFKFRAVAMHIENKIHRAGEIVIKNCMDR